MQPIIEQLQSKFPSISYRAGSTFYWSPFAREVIFNPKNPDATAIWSLLHETAHAVLGHQSYRLDVELIKLEASAWAHAQELAKDFNVSIDEDHIQDCLDTYRDWLHARSMCPRCGYKGIQLTDAKSYQCINCRARWKVAPSRFCRAYRMLESNKGVSPKVTFDTLVL